MKTAPSNSSGAAKTRPTWPDVLRVLPDDASRNALVAKLTASSYTADSFGTSARARDLVADVLTRLEDRLELAALDAGGSGRGRRRELLTAQRGAIAGVRRALEAELR